MFFLSILLVLATFNAGNKLYETLYESLSIFGSLCSIRLLSINIPEDKTKIS